MLSDYFRRVLAAVEECPAVFSSDLSIDQRGPRTGFIKGEIAFQTGAVLHIRELVNFNLDRFPHHKHSSPSTVIPSNAPSIEDVLNEIVTLINQ